MHIIKIKGTDKIPDFIQIRDDDFKLIAYFSAKNISRGLKRNSLEKYADQIEEVVKDLEYYKIVKINNR